MTKKKKNKASGVIAGKNSKPNSADSQSGDFLTSPKQLAEKLKEVEVRYRVALENSGQLLYDLDLASGRIAWSGNIFGVTGYQPAEFEKFDVAKWEEMIHPDDRRRASELLSKAIKTRTKYHIEYRFRRKKGNYAFIDDEGVIVGDSRMVGTMKDISVFREKIEELEKINDLLVGRELKMVELKEEIKRLQSSAPLVQKAAKTWAARFKEAINLEEDVIWQLQDGYLRAIAESNLNFLKKNKAKKIIRQLANESIHHRDQLENLSSHYESKKK